MSRVSFATRVWVSGGWNMMVLMLWSLSASLMMMTRMSLTVAISILRSVAAWAVALVLLLMDEILVTPSTSLATSSPKAFSSMSSVVPVSSTVS